MESSLSEEKENEVIEIIRNNFRVKGFHNLKTRKIGNIVAIEVHIKVDKDLTVEASHQITTEIENKIRDKFGDESHIGIHVEPYYKSQ